MIVSISETMNQLEQIIEMHPFLVTATVASIVGLGMYVIETVKDIHYKKEVKQMTYQDFLGNNIKRLAHYMSKREIESYHLLALMISL